MAEDAMIYQIAKYIGSMAIVLEGKVDFIALTGGLMYSKYIQQAISTYVSCIDPVDVFPVSAENDALREAARLALDNPKIVKKYS